MNLIVRCPGCQTRYQATEQQLRVARGWVRCGRCQQSFDAVGQAASSPPVPVDARAPLLQRVSSDAHKSASPAFTAAPAPRESLVQRAAHERRPASRSPAPTASAPAAPSTPAFLRETSTHPAAAGQRADGRSFGWPIGAALVLLLLAQVLLQHRDGLAARAPATAPMFAHACALLGCTIAPPRDIDALVIDNSSLTKTGANGYRLSLALQNRSDLRLAMPGVELSLLDAAERTLVRRVLLARDVGAGDAIEPYGEWVGAVHFDLPGRAERIAGYRVLAFYP